MLKQPTHDFLLETSVDYHTSCFATLRSFSSSLLLSRHYSTLVEESRRYQRELSDRGCSPEEAEEIVEQVLDAKLCEQKSSTTKKKPRQECPFHRKVASLNSNACGKLLGSRSRSRPAIYPRLSRRRRLCSRLWSATTAWNWVIPMKRMMPPCRTQERRNFWVCQNVNHSCASAKSSIPQKGLSFFTFWGFIVPTVTIS